MAGDASRSPPSAEIAPLKIDAGLVDVSSSYCGSTTARGGYRALRRLVTQHPRYPGSGSITTVLEEVLVGRTDGGGGYATKQPNPSRLRVAVYNGPVSSEQQLHASFQLPSIQSDNHSGNAASPLSMCWASFPLSVGAERRRRHSPDGEGTSAAENDRGNGKKKQDPSHHPLLCVLVNPTNLSLWDVYPESDGNDTNALYSTESSWTVSLPFECCGVAALPGGGGLLLQRQAGPEDAPHHTAYASMTAVHRDPTTSDFVLQSPPHSLANAQQPQLPPDPWTPFSPDDEEFPDRRGEMAVDEAEEEMAAAAVASLFSLQHPLEDVVPVSEILKQPLQHPQQEQVDEHESEGRDIQQALLQRPITDVFEQIVWVGCAEWMTSEGEAREQVVAVTYHLVERRHAIWTVQDAPPPPQEPPLYQRMRRNNDAAGSPDGQPLAYGDWGVMSAHAHAPSPPILEPVLSAEAAAVAFPLEETRVAAPADGVTSRDEALANALGVARRTPRKSMDRQERSRSVVPTSAPGASSNHNHSGPSSEAPSFFSPRSGPGVLDASLPQAGMETSMPNMAATVAGGPFASLYASVSMECRFREEESSAQANNVFLVSNLEGSGTLVLCWTSPVVGAGSDRPDIETGNRNQLRLFELRPTERRNVNDGDESISAVSVLPRSKCDFAVVPLPGIVGVCRSVQPIQSTPVPACFARRASVHRELCTDLLVASCEIGNNDLLTLHRATRPIVHCELNVPAFPRKRMEIVDTLVDSASFLSEADASSNVPAPLALRARISLVSKSALAERILSVWDVAVPAPLALAIRADVCRLERQLTSDVNPNDALREDVGFSALRAVFMSLVEWEVFGGKAIGQQENQCTSTDQGSPWQMLLDSDFHRSFSLFYQDDLFDEDPDYSSSRRGSEEHVRVLHCLRSLSLALLKDEGGATKVVPRLFDAVHMLLEDSSLTAPSLVADLPQLALLLLQIVTTVDPRNLTLQSFREYYWRYTGEICKFAEASYQVGSPQVVVTRDISAFDEPPSLLLWVDRLMKGRKRDAFVDTTEVFGINAACTKMCAVCRILSVLFTRQGPGRDLEVVTTLLEEGFSEPSQIREDLPPGVALPILEVLYRCRNEPSLADLPGWSASAWHLVGRKDLSRNLVYSLSRENDSIFGSRIGLRAAEDQINDDRFTDADNDGLVPLEKSSSGIFPEDNRIHEAARLLRSSRPIFLRVQRAVEVSDHDYERLKQKRLLLLSKRTLALPVGRGMLSLGSLQPVAAEPLPIPELCLKGRVPPTNASLALTEECPSDMRVWPEFHNGVAAGLRLPHADETGVKMTRTWIVYNRPPPASQAQADGEESNTPQQRLGHSHGGLLLALGLRGHLTALEMSDIYEYLTQGSVTTTVGVLLGMASNMRGSCDMAVSKMLCLHIPSLIPQHFSAIDVASTVQSAAVLSAGILFQRSNHRMMTEFLLNEIGKRPESDASAFDRESYTLSCGLALGMVNLCLGERPQDGDRAAGVADLRLEERLYRYMVGGVDGDESRRRRETNDRFSLPSASANGDNERCSTIFEGDLINTDVTAPGSTLALGLMYMKTGNQTIASALSLPDTHFLLEFVRPDFLALRVMARALILWDEVEPTRDWIQAQIPSVVKTAYEEMRWIAKKAMEGATTSRSRQIDYDRKAIRQIQCHLIAGACFGMGLRYAGTGDEKAAAAIFERVLELQTLRESNDAVSAASRPELPILDSCLSSAAISLAMVLAGTGDLEATKLFKILRWRCEDDSRYGHHMAYGMAIGLLFLGGGKCTLGREPEDLAALVTAFFPRFATTTSDNQYHVSLPF